MTNTSSSSGRFSLRVLALIFVVIGLLISGYLSAQKLTAAPLVCFGGSTFDCGTVTNSAWSRLAGIDIAYLGFGMYLTLGILLLLEERVSFLHENGQLITFGIAFLAWVYSMFLVYLQVFVLQALCSWCLAHEANMTILFAIIVARLWHDVQKLGTS